MRQTFAPEASPFYKEIAYMKEVKSGDMVIESVLPLVHINIEV